MSLIREALEKANKKKEAPAAVVPAPDPISTPAPIAETIKEREQKIKKWIRDERDRFVQEYGETKTKRQSRKPVTSVLSIAGVIVLGLIFFWLYRTLTTTNFSGSAKRLANGVPALVSQAAPEPKFLLTGITESGNERLALINNQVVGIGNTLKENAVVKDIQDRAVTLYFRGREIKLTL